MRRICVFTGTRAEFGIMSRLMQMIKEDKDLKLQIIATNMHLSPEFGLTYKEIEAEGFHINKKVEMLLSSDTANGTVKSMGLATIGFADALEDLKPDLAIILGDRYEMLAAAESCLIYRIPVAHIAGGAISEGAYDDAIRHCITKMSHLHFTETEEYRKRVIQLGEQPGRVFCTGALGVNNIRNEFIMPLSELEKSIGFELEKKFLLITFHPVTMENATAADQCDSLLKALSDINNEYKMLFTLPNSDTDGRVIIQKINGYVSSNSEKAFAIASLGKRRYYSALKYSTAVIGNSSSALVEAPSFNIPTLNIGNRQQGRTRGETVIDVPATYEGIRDGLRVVLSQKFIDSARTAKNPYEKNNTLQEIFAVIKSYPLEGLTRKSFYNL
ncbi:UDP-N-acetylglucosamine 2-epimerase [Bacteroides cutis]|jgi:UDP-hydrolysing UDP-N-acetyl-D-glucosamine 2-epimerase|uniref:UDP-N-acetylglucosamine 2-epimerase n=1 Tax=Bacteroides cutis TaxID=2024197 RepID=UPI0023A7E8C3|nr:UDP-N-acetylglucosamine 2-epimerase [Bacteroides cutis]